LLFAILFDLIVLEMLKVPGIYLTGFGIPAFVVMVLFILSIRFVRNANEADHLNRELELEVEDRT
jgi:hypothetical protein